MLVDSEDPVADIEKTWLHLHSSVDWKKPDWAIDDHVLMMTTCMETWIVCDHTALLGHYGANLQVNALPDLVDIEQRNRHAIQGALVDATRNCSNAYSKGKRSFEVLAQLTPNTLLLLLPSFARVVRILKTKL